MLEEVLIDLGIELGRLDRPMSQDLGDALEPDALTQHLTRSGMAEDVGPKARRSNSSALQRTPRYVPDCAC